MKVKDLRAILNRYKGSDELYLLLENGYGKTIRHAISMNKVERHYSHNERHYSHKADDQNEVHVWLGWKN